MAPNLAVTAALAVAMVTSTLFNFSYIVVYIARKRMKKIPTNLFLFCLAIVDLLGTFLWTMFTVITASAGEWTLGDIICKVQVYFFGFCPLVNAMVLTVLMGERLLKVFKPSRNAKIFFHVVVVLMVGMILLFNAVLASFPIIGWGRIQFMEKQLQCSINYIFHDSQLDFSFFWQFAFPVPVIIACYVAILIRVKMLRKNLSEGEAIILEQKTYAVEGDAYADRLKKQRQKFQNAGIKKKKPKMKSDDANNDEGYKSSSAEGSSSEEESGEASDTSVISTSSRFSEIFENRAGGTNQRRNKQRNKKARPSSKPEDKKKGDQRIYYMSKEDLLTVHMYAAASAAYFGTWFLYFIMSYMYTQELGSRISSDFVIVAVCISHFCSFVKTPFYLISRRNRHMFIKTFTCGGKREGANDGKTKPKVEEKTQADAETGINRHGELTTEL